MKQDLSEHRVTARPATILAADGSILAVLPSAESPEPVPLAEVAPAMISALLAAEDHRYYTHTGVDLHAMTRALKRDVDAGRIVEGGSTITQQYVRNVLLPASRRTERKLKEVTMAIELDDRLRKNQILERYLNAVYFGDQSYGIQRAAQNFFGIDAADLSLSQAADLAGVLQSPSTLEPRGHLRASTKRRNVVLNRMEELGFISKQQHTNAIRDPLEVAPRAA
ncbi:MAG: biosynthetic peptidoglycan transglycosylase, partial [Acidimicrobiia bacterium]